MNSVNLDYEWITLLDSSNLPSGQGQAFYKAICDAYSQPHRHYHTLSHLSEILSLLKSAQQESLANLWATWFHDVVYVPGKRDNEALSATYAREVMETLGVEQSIVEMCVSLIHQTKTHKTDSSCESGKAFLDADMAILGAPSKHYENYCKQVLNEFKSIPSILYKRGRKKFLAHLLEQDVIYLTPWFYERFEKQARINIKNEIQHL